MSHYSYRPQGVCSSKIEFDIEDGILKNVRFTNGCSGNAKGVASLAEGMNINDVVSKLKGIPCGMKPTSCPDQLARAIIKAMNE